MSVLAEEIHRLRKRHGCTQRRDILPVCHNVLGLFISKRENIVYHLRLAGQKNALLMSLIHHGDDLFFRHIIGIAVRIHPKEACQKIRKKIRHKNQRKENDLRCTDKADQQARPPPRLSRRDFLRCIDAKNQNPEHHGRENQHIRNQYGEQPRFSMYNQPPSKRNHQNPSSI